jgi:hypothetical protein
MKAENEADTCLNCGESVDKVFCSNCGQKKEVKHHFYHLFSHFISDFIHYDSSFWRTLRMLFQSPGKLSLEYINGRRKRYVSPFSLYIFVSVIAFFSISFFPVSLLGDFYKDNLSIETSEELRYAFPKEDIRSGDEGETLYTEKGVLKFIREYEKDLVNKDRFISNSIYHLPKTLFVYMPVFAFWLWIFYRKKENIILIVEYLPYIYSLLFFYV